MKKLIISLTFLFIGSLGIRAQIFPRLDRSPLDIAYFPYNYAHDRQPGEKAIIKVVYSRPLKKDRGIFGQLIPFGQVWRIGANENTEIKFYQDVLIDGKKVVAGTYSLFAIPGEKQWTIIFNSDIDYWGAFSYNQEHDILRVTAKSKTIESTIEAFTIKFEKSGDKGIIMNMAWSNTLVELPIGIK